MRTILAAGDSAIRVSRSIGGSLGGNVITIGGIHGADMRAQEQSAASLQQSLHESLKGKIQKSCSGVDAYVVCGQTAGSLLVLVELASQLSKEHWLPSLPGACVVVDPAVDMGASADMSILASALWDYKARGLLSWVAIIDEKLSEFVEGRVIDKTPRFGNRLYDE